MTYSVLKVPLNPNQPTDQHSHLPKIIKFGTCMSKVVHFWNTVYCHLLLLYWV